MCENELRQKNIDQFFEHRKVLLSSQQSLADLFDKLLVSMASGTLGLSVTFLRFVAPNPVPGTSGWIFACWILSALSLLLALLSLNFAQEAIEIQLDNLESQLEAFVDSTEPPPDKHNRWSTATLACNWLSFAALLCGFFCFAFFSYANLGRPKNGKEEKVATAAAEPETGGRTKKDSKKEGIQEKGSQEKGSQEKDGQEENSQEENSQEENSQEENSQEENSQEEGGEEEVREEEVREEEDSQAMSDSDTIQAA